jgi:hypothetical protein
VARGSFYWAETPDFALQFSSLFRRKCRIYHGVSANYRNLAATLDGELSAGFPKNLSFCFIPYQIRQTLARTGFEGIFSFRFIRC